MAIRAAIFDLDGTLLDSTGIWRQIDEIFWDGADLTFLQITSKLFPA